MENEAKTMLNMDFVKKFCSAFFVGIFFACMLSWGKTKNISWQQVCTVSFDQTIEKFTVTQIDRGKLKMVLKAETATISDSKDIAHLKFVDIEFYDNGKFVSRLITEIAKVDKVTCDVYGGGKCVLSTVNGEKLETTDLTYNTGKNLIYSKGDVKITRSKETVYGTSFQANTRLNKIVIENQKTVFKGNVIVTGDKMEIERKNDNTVTCRGNSKISNKDVIITAGTIIYNETRADISASGGVDLLSNSQGSIFKAHGDLVDYDMGSQKSNVRGNVKVISEDVKNIYTICANEISINGRERKVNANTDEKSEGRPSATISCSDFDGDFTADRMMFCNDIDGKKKISMGGRVSGQIRLKK